MSVSYCSGFVEKSAQMGKSSSYRQGLMEKLAAAPGLSASLASRTPLEMARLLGATGIGYGIGTATGLWNPGDPAHRTFSSQAQGVGTAAGAGLGGMTGFHLADQLQQSAAGGKKGWTGFALRAILPFIMGSAGGWLGGHAGHTAAKARYEGNTLWEKATGQPTYDDRRRERIKNALKALAVTGGLAGAGYGAYRAYQYNKEQ